MKLETVIFDLDGTLIDSSEGIVHAAMETIEILNLDYLEPEFIKSCIGPPIADSIGSKVGYNEDTIKRFYEVFRPIYKDKYLMECEIYPGIRDLLEKLKTNGIKTGIATNKRVDYTMKLLENIKLLDLLDDVQAMDFENKLRKSDLLTRCLKNLDSEQSKSIMVGDTNSDLEAAKKCNVDFIGVCYGFGFTADSNPGIRLVKTVDELQTTLLWS